MPTGYTADLYDGKPLTFPQFAMQCSRAFGALIEMRDSAPDAQIPQEFTVDPYYRENLAGAQARLAEIEGWDGDRAAAEAARENAAEVARITESNATSQARRERYEAMLMEARAWSPPTPEHAGMQEFMIEQLEGSIKHDCYTCEIPEPQDAEIYRAQQLEYAQRQVNYYRDEYAKEVERAAGRTEWVRALRESLTPQSANA